MSGSVIHLEGWAVLAVPGYKISLTLTLSLRERGLSAGKSDLPAVKPIPAFGNTLGFHRSQFFPLIRINILNFF